MARAIDDCCSPVEKVFHWAERKPGSIFLRQRQADGSVRDYSWLDVAREVDAAAAGLRGLGLVKGDRIAILGGNSAHWLMADLAIQRAGCTSLPIYTTMSADGVRHILETCPPRALMLGAASNWSAVGDCFGRECIRIGLPESVPGTCEHTWQGLSERGGGEDAVAFPALDDWYTILQTSGSTGLPKGVVQTFRSPAVSSRDFAATYATGEGARFISYLPLAHAGERTLVLGCCIQGGGTLYFGGSPKDFLVDLRAARPTFFLGVPRIWEKLRQASIATFSAGKLKAPDQSAKRQVLEWLGFESLATAITGGAPMPPDLIDWYQALGLEVLEAYASSEIASAVVSTHEHHRSGSVGRALPNVRLRIGDNGEILIRSASCMLGYFGEPEKTREALADGWMHTGDMGRLDEDGYLFITGRLKDIYKTAKGKYVAPLPIERRFAGNIHLEQVCLVGEGLMQPVLVAQPSAIVQSSDRSEIERQLGATLDEVNRSLQAHERIKFILLTDCEWNETNGLCTHSLKIKRKNVEAAYAALVADIYRDIERTGSKVHWQ